MRWLKETNFAVVWTILRVWLGFEWLRAGLNKIDGTFDATGFLKGAVAKATGDHPAVQSWYAAFLEGFAIPNVGLFNILIPWGEVLVGVGLIVGFATIPALLAGAFMNLNFLLAGTTSTNPILYTVAVILLFLGATSYYYGVDRYITPSLRGFLKKKEGQKNNHAPVQ
ncbi:DoxX family protein [Bacillus timonensis]|nr:DoxX family protein [Bacillus timonensis]